MRIETEFSTNEQVFVLHRELIVEEVIERIDITFFKGNVPLVRYYLSGVAGVFEHQDLFHTKLDAGAKLLELNGLTVELGVMR